LLKAATSGKRIHIRSRACGSGPALYGEGRRCNKVERLDSEMRGDDCWPRASVKIQCRRFGFRGWNLGAPVGPAD
jgi:hypothetical protein